MIKQETEIVPIKAVEPENPNDPHYRVKVVKSFLVGNRVVEPGEVVRLPERSARDAVKCGAAVGIMSSPGTVFFEKPTEAPKAAPVENRSGGRRIKLLTGNLYQDGRVYSPSDGVFSYRGDVIALLAMQTAEPGSLAEASARQTSRNRPTIEIEGELSRDEKKRLGRLRKNPVEPTKAEVAKAVYLLSLASA
jgi:hypothetical protein